MINGTLGIIKDKYSYRLEGKIVDIFRDEKYAVRAFNLLLIPDIIRLICKLDSKTIYCNENNFLNLITILSIIPLSFNEEKLNVEVYTLIYELISPIVESPDKYSNKLITGILGCKIFDLVLKIPKSNKEHLENISIGQTLLLEIALLLKRLHMSAPHCECILEFPMDVLHVDRIKTIISEKFDFDMIPYMIFYENLTKNIDNLEIEIEEGTTTTSIGYDVRTVAKFEYADVYRLQVRATLDTRLRQNEFIAFSTDAECKDIFACLNKQNIQKSDSSYINSNRFYVHYPYKESQTFSYG